VLGPHRQCHERPGLALLGFPIQCPKPHVRTSQTVLQCIRGPALRFPYCATGRPDQPFRDSIYSANRGPGAACWSLSDSAMGGPDPIGFRFVLIMWPSIRQFH